MSEAGIWRLELGYYTMPAGTALAAQKIVACAYLIRHESGFLLFDTGIGAGHAVPDQFGPIRRESLDAELAKAGLSASDVSCVANCHLHRDHCGGNPRFPKTPIFIQRSELDAMPSLDYVQPELIDFAGATLEVHDGEAEIWPGVLMVPTPGHTPGHQSLIVGTSRGRVMIAGQAMNFASEFGRAYLLDELQAGDQKPRGDVPGWLGMLRDFDVTTVLFAHDLAVWQRGLAWQ